MDGISFDNFIGGSNDTTEIASANSDFTHLFSVKNSYTHPVRVRGIQTRYKAGLEDCKVKFKDGDGVEIISGKPQLTNIGNTYNAAVGFNADLLPVDFILPAGSEVYVFISNRTIPVSKSDISILFCVKNLGNVNNQQPKRIS